MAISQEELKNRFDHHPPTDEKVHRHEAVREAAREFARLVNDECPAGREQALALTKIEEAMFWSNAAIARNG